MKNNYFEQLTKVNTIFSRLSIPKPSLKYEARNQKSGLIVILKIKTEKSFTYKGKPPYSYP